MFNARLAGDTVFNPRYRLYTFGRDHLSALCAAYDIVHFQLPYQ